MKIRSVVALVWLAIGFAVPTFAQQKDTPDPQTSQKILAIGKAFDEGEKTTTTQPPSLRSSRTTRFL